MNNLFALIRLYVLEPALWTLIVAAAAPNICPFLAVLGTTIVVDELDLSPILRQAVKRQYSANGGRHGVVSKEVHARVQVGGVGANRVR